MTWRWGEVESGRWSCRGECQGLSRLVSRRFDVNWFAVCSNSNVKSIVHSKDIDDKQVSICKTTTVGTAQSANQITCSLFTKDASPAISLALVEERSVRNWWKISIRQGPVEMPLRPWMQGMSKLHVYWDEFIWDDSPLIIRVGGDKHGAVWTMIETRRLMFRLYRLIFLPWNKQTPQCCWDIDQRLWAVPKTRNFELMVVQAVIVSLVYSTYMDHSTYRTVDGTVALIPSLFDMAFESCRVQRLEQFETA